jgi:hypothetical protein
MRASRYLLEKHFEDRCEERNFSIFDAKHLIANATRCEPYVTGTPRHGGTCWRIVGPDIDGTLTGLGVELFRDHLGKVIAVVTLTDES